MMNTNETGRSMVEMLGVLAIIGVLSVGGIAGYNMAMKRYRANEILNTASMMVMMAAAKDGGNGGTITSLASAGLDHPYGSVEISATGSANGSAGSVTITGVGDDDVCNAVKSSVNTSLYTVTNCS